MNLVTKLYSCFQIEKHSIEFIPLSERHGKAWHLWPVWFAGDAHLATLAVGALSLGLGQNLIWSAIAILLGCAFGTFFMAFHATQGPKLGLPQMIQSRPQFGYMGALLVWIVASITYIGFNSFNQLLVGSASHQLTGIHPTTGYIIFTIFALILSVFGYRWIHRAQRYLAYLLLITLTIFTIGIFAKLSFSSNQFSLSHFKCAPFILQFFAAAAYQLSWSIYVSDYTRYLPPNISVRQCFWWTFAGAFTGGAWMMLIGAVVASLYLQFDLIVAIQEAGNYFYPHFGTATLLLALLGLLTITSINFYGASLTLLSIIDSFKPLQSSGMKRISSLIFAALLSTLIAVYASNQFMTKFSDFLNILLYLFTPWTAINLIDFYVVRKSHYVISEIFNPHGIYGRWNWRGLSSYLFGFLAMIPFFKTHIYTGPAARVLGDVDVAMIIGLITSTVVYLLVCHSFSLVDSIKQVIKSPYMTPIQLNSSSIKE